MLSNGKEIITTKSTLLCKGCGGEIRAVTSGQDGVEAERIAKEIELIRGTEEKYPGLFDILKEPYESLYLKEGMYQARFNFWKNMWKRTAEKYRYWNYIRTEVWRIF